ncbi:MAG TPA: hypothetical protein VFA33_24150 [Bryobacteraceae bacterium]|nr:hypothetical protein [Bryobacteraceae bacterium]
MALDLRKIDERIQKLQEIRRIAADPEMVKLLCEFLTTEQGAAAVTAAAPPAAAELPVPEPQPDEVSEFVKGVLEEKDSARSNGPLLNWKSGRL